MRVKMRTMGRGAQGPPAHLGSVDLVNCVRGWLRSLWSVSEKPASETGNYRTSCNCCKTDNHMSELMLLYVRQWVWVYVCVCEKELKSDESVQGVVTVCLSISCQTQTSLEWNLNIFDAANCCIVLNGCAYHLTEFNWKSSKGTLFFLISINLFIFTAFAVIWEDISMDCYILQCSRQMFWGHWRSWFLIPSLFKAHVKSLFS